MPKCPRRILALRQRRSHGLSRQTPLALARRLPRRLFAGREKSGPGRPAPLPPGCQELPGKYKHPASITELHNGDLYLAYYGGSGEYGADSGVYGARLRKGETKWSRPERIAPPPKWPEGNAVV